MALIVLIFIITGIIMAILPKTYWKMRHFFSPVKEDPSDIYVRSTRIEGIVFIIIGIVLFATQR